MRVLYLTMNPNRMSTTEPTEGWFRILRSRGLQPVLVSHETGPFHAWAIEEGIPAVHVSLPFPNKWWPFPFLASVARLLRLVRRHRIQIIHCNEQNIYPIGQFVARLCRLPVVVSIHFTLARDFCEWAFGNGKQPDRIFFVSQGNLDACRPAVQDLVAGERWRVLPNGLDADRYRPDAALGADFRRQHGLGTGPLIGVACALRERKQLEHLFAAAQSLPADVKIVVAGGPVADERAYAEQLLATAQDQLGGRLAAVGHLDDLRGFYNALDLFVNTSREEACSISVLEALACGCPVVGYASKSVDTQILPGGGEIVPQDDVAALADSITRWLSDPARLAAAREGARQRFLTGFDIRAASDQLWQEYQAVLEERGS